MLPYFGYALRKQDGLFTEEEPIDACELSLEHNGEVPADIPYISLAGTRLAVGSQQHDREYLNRLRGLATEYDAVSLRGYLGSRRCESEPTKTPFAPLPWTEAALDGACRDVTQLQNYFEPAHFFLSTITYLFRLPSEMSEAEFVSRLLTRTGCGWVLNVGSVYANAANFHFDAYEFLAEVIPAAQRLQIHLGGGYFDERAGMYLDSRWHGIAEPVWDLYRFALQQGRGKTDAVFVHGSSDYQFGQQKALQLARSIAEETYRPVIRVH